MTERLIIFNADMVRAILDGRKSQTRVIVEPQAKDIGWTSAKCEVAPYMTGTSWPLAYYERRRGVWNSSPPLVCPFGKTGDELWVAEDHRYDDTPGAYQNCPLQDRRRVVYSDYELWDEIDSLMLPDSPVRSIISAEDMPRWASRIQLRITDVRVERVREITETDACRDGGWTYCKCPMHKDPRGSFRDLWNSIHGDDAWERNDWCWVIEFEVVR